VQSLANLSTLETVADPPAEAIAACLLEMACEISACEDRLITAYAICAGCGHGSRSAVTQGD
jgi:hypothetical protein